MTALQPGDGLWLARALRYGLGLGVLVALLNLVGVVSASYTNAGWFWIVIVVELIAAVVILRAIAPAPAWRNWPRQVAGTLVAFTVAALFIAAATWAAWTWVDPDYARTFGELAREQYEARGVAPEEIDDRVTAVEAQYQPHLQALWVLLGTILTGLFLGLPLATVRTLWAGRRSDR